MQYSLTDSGQQSPNAASLPHLLGMVYRELSRQGNPLSPADISKSNSFFRRFDSPEGIQAIQTALRQLRDLGYVREAADPATIAQDSGVTGDLKATVVPVLAAETSTRMGVEDSSVGPPGLEATATAQSPPSSTETQTDIIVKSTYFIIDNSAIRIAADLGAPGISASTAPIDESLESLPSAVPADASRSSKARWACDPNAPNTWEDYEKAVLAYLQRVGGICQNVEQVRADVALTYPEISSADVQSALAVLGRGGCVQSCGGNPESFRAV
jgi:hypothetical protein